MLTPFPLSHHKCRLIACKHTLNRSFNLSLKNMVTPAQNLLKIIKACQNITDLDTPGLITDFALAYGSFLAQAATASYVTGARSARRLRHLLSNNPALIDEILSFSWELPNLAAVSAFTSQAFTIAGVQSAELLDSLKQSAAQVIRDGGTFADFRDKAVLAGFEPQNPYHLRTNFNTAVSSAYQAGRWQSIQSAKDYFPYLRYVTMQDDKVRDEHSPLNGIILPVDDSFWITSYPPNDWNCRCDVEQLTAEEAQTDPLFGKDTPDFTPSPQWDTNPGRTNLLLGDYDKLKQAKSLAYSDYGLPNCSNQAGGKVSKTNLDGLSKQMLIEQYRLALGDKLLADCNGQPALFSMAKADKFKNYHLEDIKGRLAYIDSLQEVIKKPTEKWYNPADNRFYYYKKYDKNLVILAEMKDGVLEYFNIMLNRDKEVDKKRKGVLLYKS